MCSPALDRLLDRLLVAGAVVSATVFLYFVHQYGWPGQREFPSGAATFVRYGLALAAALGFLAARRLRAEVRLNVVLALGSLAVALWAGEVVLAHLTERRIQAAETLYAGAVAEARMDRVARIAAAAGVDFDTRSRLQVVLDLRDEGIDAVPIVPPREVLREGDGESLVSSIVLEGEEVFPLGGISGATTVLCNETGEYVVFESDRFGFHNPPGVWDDRPADVVAIGDSFAHGMCVPSDRNFVARIRERVPHTVNLGMSGTGPLFQLAVLEEYARDLEPRTVLWFYFEDNDHLDLVTEARSEVLLRYLSEEGFRQGLEERQAEVDAALREVVDRALEQRLAHKVEGEDEESWTPREVVRSLLRPIRLVQIRRGLGLLEARGAGREVGELPEALFREIAVAADRRVRSWGGRLLFVYLPARDRYATGREYPRAEVLAVVEEAGIPIIDMHEAFEATGDPLALFPFRRFGHYTEEGHALVAETLLAEIRAGESVER